MREASAVAPPPWTLHGDAYVLPVWMPADAALAGECVPAGWQRRRGGLEVLMFVRYADSNVGAYDELLWLAARGLRRERGWQHAVTAIFVSSEASRASGRANWGIPKKLATFDVDTDHGSCQVRISVGDGLIASFDVSSSACSVPFDARWLPARLRTLVQELDGHRFETTPTARGRLHHARFSRLWFGSSHFPDPTRGRLSPALALHGFEMTFPPARVTARAG